MSTLATLYLTKLLIIGCTGTDPSAMGECDASVEPHTWVGLTSKQECETFIRTEDFDPTDYLPNWGSYIVRCAH